MAKSTTIGSIEVKETRDYKQFTVLKGNRHLDPAHVGRLIKNMLENGNLTMEFPIVVNQKLEIIDGQHRFAALKELGWPIAYRIQPDLSLEAVRGINQAARNWTWKDFAQSYADLGNDNYQRFLNLYKHFGFSYSVLARYSGIGDARGAGRTGFKLGELELGDQEEIFKKLKQYQDVSVHIEKPINMLAFAMLKIMHNPAYNHEQMVKKAEKFGGQIGVYATLGEYLRALEEMYNLYIPEENKVRLF